MEMQYRQAGQTDRAALTALWRLCFPEDDEAFVSRFLDVVPITQALVACKGEVLAMLFLLPAEVVHGQCRYSVRYLYAGCTHPAHRGEGVFAGLLRYAVDFTAATGGCAIYLHPASDSLVTYYERQGYHPGIGGWKNRDGVGRLPHNTVSTTDYLTARERFLPTDRPCWRLLSPGDSFFLEELLADGWQALADNSGCGVVSPDSTYFYDCLGSCPSVAHFGADDAGEWQNTAWWIAAGEAEELIAAMMETKAYTAFLGDI